MPDNVQEIKDKLNIVDYIKQFAPLISSGKNLKGLCPFHKEKTPSFMVSPDRQIWHCFGGCNTGGDIFSFVMKYENVEFYEALKILAEKAGIDLKRAGGGDFQKYNRLYEINEAAKDFFHKNLGKESVGYLYLKDRGLNDQTIDEFEIGVAQSSSDALLGFLLKKGFSREDVEKAGLVFRTDRGTYWDRFRNRLMFPLYNAQGKVVGFTGRVLDIVLSHSERSEETKDPSARPPAGGEARQGRQDDRKFVVAKYVNSPETPIFQKSKFLYGFHKAKNFIREKNEAVLVEGQMDFLMSWQDGLKNVVATSGTALTNDHLILLKRACDQLVLSFDNDAAGIAAAERSIDLASALDFSIKVLTIDGGKDPADLVRANPGAMIQFAEKAQPAMAYYFNKYSGRQAHSAGSGQATIYQKKKNLRLILSKLKNIPSAVERSSWLKELSAKTNLAEDVLLEEMDSLKIRTSDVLMSKKETKSIIEETAPAFRKDIIAKRIFGLVYHNSEFVQLVESAKDFLPATYKDLFNNVKSLDWASLQPDGTKEELEQLLQQLKLEFYKHRQKSIRSIMNNAEIKGDELALGRAMREFDIISRELHNINTHGQEKGKKDQKDKEQEEDWF